MVRCLSLSLCLLVLLVVRSVVSLRGVDPKDLALYSSPLTCLDRTIPVSAINDDFCDCPQLGNDEPGTSACARGTFYCVNKGYVGKRIQSAYVDDGICDCCDGSDEKNGVCEDQCAVFAKELREKAEMEMQELRKGIKKRKNIVQKAKDQYLKEKERLEAVNLEIHALNAELEKLEELKTKLKAMKVSLLGDDSEVNEQQNSGNEQEKEADAHPMDSAETEKTQGSENDAAFPYPKEYRFDENAKEKKSEQKEEEGSFPYPEEYRYNNDHNHDHDDDHDHVHDHDHDHDHPSNSYVPHTEKNPVPVDDDDDDDSDDDGAEPGVFDSILAKAMWVFGLANKESDINEGNVLSHLKSVRRQVKKLKSEIKNREDERDRINQDIDKDYGPDREFTALSKMCVSIHQKPYEYEICPFKEAKQKEGHSSTSLGTYSGWKDDAKYKTMMFTNGQKCWNGPYRSATVHLSCGEDDSLVSADEPSVCAYEFVLKTPAACSESKLHELESQYH